MPHASCAALFIYTSYWYDRRIVTKQSAAQPADSLLNPDIKSQRSSEILYGAENAVGRGVQFMRNVKKEMDIFFDHRAPSIVVILKNTEMDTET